MVRLSLWLIDVYQKILSPFWGGQCRFSPTCSSYAREAISKHGVIKGWILAIFRISRCHPWSKCNWIDPVPERFDFASLFGYKKFRLPITEEKEVMHHE